MNMHDTVSWHAPGHQHDEHSFSTGLDSHPTRPLPSFLAGGRRLLVAITSRFLFSDEESFWQQVRATASADIDAFILREKDLSPEEYERAARRFVKVCDECGTTPMIHSRPEVALRLGKPFVQMPLPLLKELSRDDDVRQGSPCSHRNGASPAETVLRSESLSDEKKRRTLLFGTSVHSAQDARDTRELPVSWVIASNVFPTDCKKGLPGRGLDFIASMKAIRPDLPVIGLGGIGLDNTASVVQSGADGVALMSGFMLSDDPASLANALRRAMDS